MGIKVNKLLKLRIADTVKKAVENGDLTFWNAYEWATKYNDGMRDERFCKSECDCKIHGWIDKQ